MQVGDYVRTKSGEIGKLVNVEVYYVLGQNDKDKYSCVLFNNNYIPAIVSNEFIIKKGQLIDLIEVGDYVNGYMVENIDAGLNGDIIEIATGTNYFQSPSLYNEDIKSIVTKEQFKEMEYKI